MQRIRTRLRRFRYFLKRDYLTLNNIVLFSALILLASWTIGAISSMSRNWELEQKLHSRQQTAARLRLEIETLRLEQQYYQTNEYQELMARAKSNRMSEGETIVILPENSESARNKYAEIDEEAGGTKSNFQQWLDFLFS